MKDMVGTENGTILHVKNVENGLQSGTRRVSNQNQRAFVLLV